MAFAICVIAECDRPAHARGWCTKHYRRWQKTGSPLAVRNRLGTPVRERFWQQVDKTDGCWLWTGPVWERGYAKIGWQADGVRHDMGVHRFAYEDLVGPIPEGLTLDHLCHTNDPECVGGPTCQHRRCVRPDHLEPSAIGTNAQRGGNSRKTHCPRGHAFDNHNTYARPDGRRGCRKCRRAAWHRWNERRG